MSDVITIEGVKPSAELREDLRGQRVILAFSRGKDSILAWIKLREAGVEVLPFYRYSVPGLRIQEDNLKYFEDYFQTPILRIPHVSMLRWLNNYVVQPPQRCRVIDEAGIMVPEYRQSNDLVCEHFGIPREQAWICDGVRATDTPDRRRAISMYGPINENERQIHIVWDWRLPALWKAIKDAGIEIPPDYALFGRSLDGMDYRYLIPLRQEYPDDYETFLRWFPLADLDVVRFDGLSRRHPDLKLKWKGRTA